MCDRQRSVGRPRPGAKLQAEIGKIRLELPSACIRTIPETPSPEETSFQL
jgi:hypothetical protein